jgi:hypothetical protein
MMRGEGEGEVPTAQRVGDMYHLITYLFHTIIINITEIAAEPVIWSLDGAWCIVG